MAVYISILRGINVGGSRKIQMKDLKEIYESIGFQRVITYIQSGNVLFTAKNNIAGVNLSAEIEQAILEKLGMQVTVIIRTSNEMLEIIKGNPFLQDKNIDQDKLHVTFLSENPEKSEVNLINEKAFEPERFKFNGKNVYLYCPNGYGRTKLSNSLFENKLKQRATTRNWRTICKLSDIAVELNR
jgi:uncharacterized protein (DUF1697 family)